MKCVKVSQGCRHLQQLEGKCVLMKYSDHWEFHKMFFSSHKYNLSFCHSLVTHHCL